MRVVLLLLLVVGCSKKAAEKAPEPPRLEQQATEREPAKAANVPVTGGAPPPPAGGSAGSAVDQARATGVLGPSDRAAFDVKGTIAIKSANAAVTKSVEAKRDALQACYDKALQFQDTLAGDVVLEATAGKLVIARSTVKHAELEKCVTDTLADAELPKGGKASVTLAFKRS